MVPHHPSEEAPDVEAVKAIIDHEMFWGGAKQGGIRHHSLLANAAIIGHLIWPTSLCLHDGVHGCHQLALCYGCKAEQLRSWAENLDLVGCGDEGSQPALYELRSHTEDNEQPDVLIFHCLVWPIWNTPGAGYLRCSTPLQLCEECCLIQEATGKM